jgi:alanine racemase
MAVVKADGYGHGAVPVARAAAAGGARCFGVATLQEGVELRQAGLSQPVLVLGNLTHPDELRACLHWQLMPTLSGMREALLCQNLAAGSGRAMAVHLKLDTGMARLGAPWQEGQRLVEAIAALEAVELAGIYSHLADADAPGDGLDPLTQRQQQHFDAVLSGLRQAGLPSGCRHLANSAATLRSPGLHYDLVRVGLALYGHRPAAHLGGELALQPAMQVRARVSLIRTVSATATASPPAAPAAWRCSASAMPMGCRGCSPTACRCCSRGGRCPRWAPSPWTRWCSTPPMCRSWIRGRW